MIQAICRRHKRQADAMKKSMAGKDTPQDFFRADGGESDRFAGDYDIHDLVQKKKLGKLKMLFGDSLVYESSS